MRALIVNLLWIPTSKVAGMIFPNLGKITAYSPAGEESTPHNFTAVHMNDLSGDVR